MSVLLIDDAVRLAVAELIERARKKPIPWGKVAMFDDAKPHLKLEDRPPDFDRSQYRPQHLTLGSYTCAFSIEQQPAGFVRHLSVSVPRKGKLPNYPAMEMLTELFGFDEFPPTKGRVWVEEFEPGHEAINVAEVIREQEAGHA
jgi:hypothetical protein